MMKIFKTLLDDSLKQLDELETNIWVNMTNPTEEEIQSVCDKFSIHPDYIKAALDEEERSRIEIETNCTLILVDVPIMVENAYTTFPLGIILTNECMITVCIKELNLLNDFIYGKVKSFYTYKKTRFILQVLYKNATYYLQYLKNINKMSSKIEKQLHKSLKNSELIQLLDLEKSLVYFSTSLRGNDLVLEKMLKLDAIKKYPDDQDLLEDVIIENKQAIEMAKIYSNILSGTMDAFASVISNNLNIRMKFLTSVTILLTVPTMIASFFGMNLTLPLADNPFGFVIVIGISLFISGLIAFLLIKKKMF